MESGDTLFVHSSLRAVGPVVDGAAEVIRALQMSVGPDGTILLPSFNLAARTQVERAAIWDPATTRSTVGWLTEYFRTMDGTVRSDHPSHSVAARGARATEYVRGHLSKEGMRSPWDIEPWGCTYGEHSPMIVAYRNPRSRVLMAGTDYRTCTYLHVVETMAWNRSLLTDPKASYPCIDRERLGTHWQRTGAGQNVVRTGRIGRAPSILLPIRAFVDSALELFENDPAAWLIT